MLKSELKTSFLRILFILFCTYYFINSQGQTYELYPYSISQTFNQQGLINSAISIDTNFFEVDFTNRTLIGVFNGVSQNYLSTYISSKVNNTRHTFGLMAVNKNEGDYIKRNRLYLRYGVQVALSKKSKVSLGSSFGFINYLFESSVANGGGSALAKDLNIGVVYSFSKLNIGASVNQLFYPELSPLNERIVLTRYYNTNICYNILVNKSLYFDTYAFTSFYEEGLLTMKLSVISVLNSHFQVGAGYNYNHGIDAYLGFKKFKISDSNFDFMVSFLAYNTRKLSSNTDSSVEFSIRYFIE